MPDYVPQNDDAFSHWISQFISYASTHTASLGLAQTDVSDIQALHVQWDYAFTDYTNARNAYHSATDDKDSKRKPLEEKARSLAQKIQANPAVTNAQKEALGITVHKTTRTPSPVPANPPTITKIDTNTRAILRLHFADSATPEHKAKPPGVASCEIRATVGGTAPTDPNEMPLLAIDTRTPYRADFEQEEIGQTAYFALRWLNTRGQPGPWSQIFSAVVPS